MIASADPSADRAAAALARLAASPASHTNPAADPARRRRAMAYDAAATTPYNAAHWAAASGQDANASIYESRTLLIRRARYETRNNPYAAGMVETHADDLVGHGPRLQIDPPTDENDPQLTAAAEEAANRVEDAFAEWCDHADVAGILSLSDMIHQADKCLTATAGEAFWLLTTGEPDRHGVTLRVLPIESDRIGDDLLNLVSSDHYDGIEYDKTTGRPTKYHVLKEHPGSIQWLQSGEAQPVDASRMIHLYRADRPGQGRGVPWLTPSLEILAALRRLTRATLKSAEDAAAMSVLLKAQAGLGGAGTFPTSNTDVDDYSAAEIPIGAMLSLPGGIEPYQLKSEHPNATYETFKNSLINEAGRPLCMPFLAILMNAAGYNYSSGRLDLQTYHRSLARLQRWISRMALDRVFTAWWAEARLLPQFALESAFLGVAPPHQWYWPGRKHVDPLKEAAADTERLKNHTVSLATLYANEGRDWRREVRQIARERAFLRDLAEQHNLTADDLAEAPDLSPEDRQFAEMST